MTHEKGVDPYMKDFNSTQLKLFLEGVSLTKKQNQVDQWEAIWTTVALDQTLLEKELHCYVDGLFLLERVLEWVCGKFSRKGDIWLAISNLLW